MVWDSLHSIPDSVTSETSRLPPPRSTSIHGPSSGNRSRTASQTSRASSLPVIVSSRNPASRRTRSASSPPLLLSRTALVATTRCSRIPSVSTCRRNDARASTAAAILSGSRRPVRNAL